MRCGIVKKFHHQRMAIERLLHDAALDPGAAAVHQPYFFEAGGMRFLHVVIDHVPNVTRRECVKIECAFDGNGELRQRRAFRIERSLRF